MVRLGQLFLGRGEGRSNERIFSYMEVSFRPNYASGVELVRVLGARWNGRGVYLEDGWRVGAAHVLAGEERR